MYLGLVHGIRALVCDRMIESPEAPLIELLAELSVWIQATVAGAPHALGQRAVDGGLQKAGSLGSSK